MNQAKQKRLLSSQQKNAQYIFECVPKREYWTITQIMNEIERQRPSYCLNHKAILGSLRKLEHDGLIKNDGNDNYIQAPVSSPAKPRPTLGVVKSAPDQHQPEEAMAEATEKSTAIDRIQQRLEVIANLTADIETDLLELMEENERLKATASKGRQLRDLLAQLSEED